MGSAKRLLSTLTSIVSTRLELLANELHEERLHLTQMLFFALFAAFCFGMGMLLLTAFIVLLFWDEYRLVALGVLSAFFLISGALITMLLRSKVQAKPKLFSVSLAELAKDKAQLDAADE